jgi:hypothetical protein
MKELREAAAGGYVDATLEAVEKQYKAVLRELDQHAADCAFCKALESA